MKKIIMVGLVASVALAIGLTFLPIEGKAQMGPGMMGGYGYGMGSGMMGRGMGPAYGTGPTMMCPGYGYGYGYDPQKPLEEKDAKAILENYLRSTRNPNLKLGKIEDKGNVFEGEILTRNDALVDKILVDKNTGWIRSVY